MSGLPFEALLDAVVRHFYPALDRRAFRRQKRRLLPFLPGYARWRGLPATDLTVADLFRSVTQRGFRPAPQLAAYLDDPLPDERPRFTPGTRRVYWQLLKGVATLLYLARHDLLAREAEAWTRLAESLAEHRRRLPRDNRKAWILWAAWCRRAADDPFAPRAPERALHDYAGYLRQWGYSPRTCQSYPARVRSLLALLGIIDAPIMPLDPYEAQIAEILDLVDRRWHRALSPESMRSAHRQLRMFARWLLRRHRAQHTHPEDTPEHA